MKHLATRRESRERAIQFLFQWDINPGEQLETALEDFFLSQRRVAQEAEKGKATWGEAVELPPPSTEEVAIRMFAEPLIRGVLEKRDTLDASIAKVARNWDLRRMAAVDRNVLRLAIYEMLFREDIPPVVSINEAIDIAKKFSTEESGRFVNGILDKIKLELLRPAREAS